MPSEFALKLAAAKAAQAAAPKVQDVQILLDQTVAERRDELLDQLNIANRTHAAEDRLAVPNAKADEIKAQIEALLDEAADALVTLRFKRLPGNVWGDITSRAPMRLDAALDLETGYNLDVAVQIACLYKDPETGAFYACRLEGAEEVPLEDNEWRDVFTTISGNEFTQIKDAVYDLNVYGPARRVHDLKKGLATRPA